MERCREMKAKMNAEAEAKAADDVANIGKLFKVGEATDYITSSALNDMVKNTGIDLSSTKIGMIMRSLGHMSSRKEIGGRKYVVYKGLKTADYV
jgi:hypothetical protein